MNRDFAIGLVVALLLALPTAPGFSDAAKVVAPDIPAGEYRLDPSHASLIFRVNHLGFSHFTSQFRSFGATLMLDPKHPEQARVTATIDPPLHRDRRSETRGGYSGAAMVQQRGVSANDVPLDQS